jgi:hypothetical protein
MSRTRSYDQRDLAGELVARTVDLQAWWREFKSSPKSNVDLPYVAMGDLATEMVDRLGHGTTSEFDAVFHEVESALGSGDPADRSLLVVGFLEALQNVSLNRGIELVAWDHWIGSVTHHYWFLLIRSWKGALSPADFNAPWTAFAPSKPDS